MQKIWKGEKMIKFKNGEVEKNAYVIINGVEYEVHEATIKCETPVSAENLNLALQGLYPVGSIYTTTSEKNPGEILGFGTWKKKDIFHGGELIAYGFATNTTSNTISFQSEAELSFSDKAIPNKKYDIKNFVDGIISFIGDTFYIATKGIVGLVKATISISGLGGNNFSGLWWRGNSNELPKGVKLLDSATLLSGPIGATYGGHQKNMIYEVTDDAPVDTKFFVNPKASIYCGTFIPCSGGVYCSLEIEVYSKKQTTYVWERVE